MTLLQRLPGGRALTLLLLVAVGPGCRRGPAPKSGTTDGTPRAETRASAPEAGSSPAPQAVTVVATEYAFAPQGPIPSGVTQVLLEDRGRQAHHMELYRLDGGKKVQDLLPILKSGGALPRWVVSVGGPGAVESGETVDATMLLAPGSYVYVCYAPDSIGVPHFQRGMLQTVEIASGTRHESAEPVADLTLTLSEYGFRFSGPLTPGRHVIRVENAGAQAHQAFLFRLDAGRSLEEFVRWTDTGEMGPRPGHWAGGISALSPGLHAYVSADLEPGEYAVICYVGDDADGRPHYLHGMVQQLTVG